MIRKKMLKTCLPLMLAFSLALASTVAVTADDGMMEQVESADYVEDPEVFEDSGNIEKPEEDQEEAAGEDREQEKNQEKEEAPDHSEKQDFLEDPENREEADNKETVKNTDVNAGDETSADGENPEETPYQELIEEGDLIIVTVDQSSTTDAAEEAVEAVKDLSETELSALEEYIEEQGYAVTTEAMLAAASTSQVKTITFNMNGFLSLAAEGFGTGYDAMFYVQEGDFKGNANAYCIDPAKQAPGHDSQGKKISYTTRVNDYTDTMLVKIMYYGFGGPGDITGSYASSNPARHILTHMAATRRAAELGIPGAGDYTYEANATAIAKANALYTEIQSKPDITGKVSILTPVSGQQTIMFLADYSVAPRKTSIKLKKSSEDPSITAGNTCYSLAGAVYGVYADMELKKKVGSFTTLEDGSSTETLSLDAGTYYVKELTAPKGFLLDETVYKITGNAGEIKTVKAVDKPAADPVKLLIRKVDGRTGESSKLLKGAQFTVKYYAASSAGSSQKPDRSWIFETDDKGEIYLEESYKVSGDPLFTINSATPVLPLGVITIQETKAPEGYLLNKTMYTCSIEKENDGSIKTLNLPTGENSVKEMPVTTDISVKKTVSGSGGNRNTEFHFELKLTSQNGIQLPDRIECLFREENQSDQELTKYKDSKFSVIQKEHYDAQNNQAVSSADPSGTSDIKTEDTVVYSFTLQHGQEIIFKDLPVGLIYEVKEKDGESLGYTVTSENAKGTLSDQSVEVSFCNSKEMVIPTAADTNTHSMTGLVLFAALVLLLLFSVITSRIIKLRC